jgi:uncharacterized ubiquitin-like protein YukD
MLSISNHSTILQLKQAYVDKVANSEITVSNMKYLYGGKVLKDDYKLYEYKINDGMALQVMIRAA